MSKSILLTKESTPQSFTIIRIITSHTYILEVLATTSTDSLDPTILYTYYTYTINLTQTLNASKNLTKQFIILVSEAKDLTNKHNTTIADYNTIITRLLQLQT
jgi:hypothetical protein